MFQQPFSGINTGLLHRVDARHGSLKLISTNHELVVTWPDPNSPCTCIPLRDTECQLLLIQRCSKMLTRGVHRAVVNGSVLPTSTDRTFMLTSLRSSRSANRASRCLTEPSIARRCKTDELSSLNSSQANTPWKLWPLCSLTYSSQASLAANIQLP